jgi:hypothetical protein
VEAVVRARLAAAKKDSAPHAQDHAASPAFTFH